MEAQPWPLGPDFWLLRQNHSYTIGYHVVSKSFPTHYKSFLHDISSYGSIKFL